MQGKASQPHGLIVVVEDEPAVLEVLKRLVQRFMPDHPITAAATAQELFAQIDQQPVDLAIVDYRLPGMDGIRLIQALREISPQLPSLVIAAEPTPALEEQIHAAGVDVFLPKPFTLTELAECIRLVQS